MKTKKQRQQVRDALVERDGSECWYCGKQLQTKTRAKKLPTNYCHIEHKLARENGGTDDLSNLVLSCKHCNTRKSTQDYDQFIQDELARVTKHYETLQLRTFDYNNNKNNGE